jgi:hypothetical protein
MRAWLLCSLFSLGIAVACGSGDDGAQPDPLATRDPDGGTSNGGPDPGTSSGNTTSGGETDPSPTPYNQVTQKSVHNAYDRDEPMIDQLLYDNVRSVEIDIHKGKGADAPAGQWWVYHIDAPTQDGSTCKFLDDCLATLKAFHKAMPNHEVVTLYVDFKDGWVNGHMPEDFDEHVSNILGRENIAAPADWVAECPGAKSLRESVTGSCKFPSLGSLRSKFIIAGTGGSACDAKSNVAVYGGAQPTERIAFLSADLNADCPLAKYDDHPNIVFLNMNFDGRDQAQAVRDKGLVGRIYKGGLNGGLDTADDFNAAKVAGAQHLATDKVNVDQDPWSTTTALKGFPFSCNGCDGLREASPLLAVTADSGDQEGKEDSGFFAYQDEGDGSESTWTALIGVPSSHTEKFAKACLIARASDEPGAANVSFCRPFDNEPPRLQLRLDDGETTVIEPAPKWPNFSDDTGFFVRLHIKPVGADTQVDASVSKDGADFGEPLSQRVLHTSLPLRGVSVSSHGSGKKRAFFAGLTRNVPDLPPQSITAAKLTTKKAIGTNAKGDARDGALAP